MYYKMRQSLRSIPVDISVWLKTPALPTSGIAFHQARLAQTDFQPTTASCLSVASNDLSLSSGGWLVCPVLTHGKQVGVQTTATKPVPYIQK